MLRQPEAGSEPAEEGAEPVVEPLPAMQVAAITAVRLVAGGGGDIDRPAGLGRRRRGLARARCRPDGRDHGRAGSRSSACIVLAIAQLVQRGAASYIGASRRQRQSPLLQPHPHPGQHDAEPHGDDARCHRGGRGALRARRQRQRAAGRCRRRRPRHRLRRPDPGEGPDHRPVHPGGRHGAGGRRGRPGGKAGVVEAISMRTITLRAYNGDVHTIPYSSIDVVTNMTKDFSFYVFDLRVAYKEDVDRVIEVLREIDSQLRREWPYRRLMLEPLEIAGVDAFQEFGRAGQGTHQGARRRAVEGRARVQPAHQAALRRARHRAAGPAAEGLLQQPVDRALAGADRAAARRCAGRRGPARRAVGKA